MTCTQERYYARKQHSKEMKTKSTSRRTRHHFPIPIPGNEMGAPTPGQQLCMCFIPGALPGKLEFYIHKQGKRNLTDWLLQTTWDVLCLSIRYLHVFEITLHFGKPPRNMTRKNNTPKRQKKKNHSSLSLQAIPQRIAD